jgi:hypothetical protein
VTVQAVHRYIADVRVPKLDVTEADNAALAVDAGSSRNNIEMLDK